MEILGHRCGDGEYQGINITYTGKLGPSVSIENERTIQATTVDKLT